MKTNKTKKQQPKIVIEGDPPLCHHMPDGARYPELKNGMTFRAALAELRRADWGNIGGTFCIDLDDGTWFYVELQAAAGGGELMNSQHVCRYASWQGREYVVRKYPL